MSFVREDELTDEEKAALTDLGKSGRVVIREQSRPVASLGLFRPTVVAKQVELRIPYKFRVDHVVRSWKKLQCRPPLDSDHPERTTEKYCVYDQPHRDYLYTQAFIDKVVRETSTEVQFRSFIGLAPLAKSGA